MLVVRFDPPSGTLSTDPVMLLGDERLGTTPDYAGLAELSQRVHRVEYLMDPRGGGHSEPSLDCPEVKAAGPELVALRMRDPGHAEVLRAAIQQCHDRLVAEGIDLSSYDFAATAADLHDLRVALGITEWNGQAFGPASEVAFEEARLYPDGLHSLTIDSPTLLDPNEVASGPAALDLAIAHLASACTATTTCAMRAPNLKAMIDRAIAELDGKPRTFDVDGTVQAILLGHPIRVVVDGTAMLRFIRAKLGGDRPDGAAVVTTVLRVLDGTLSANDQAVVQLSSDIGDCLGMVPLCDRENFGTLLSLGCADAISDVGRATLERNVAGRKPYADLFEPGPLGAQCETWGVKPVALASGPFGGGVPLLILRGEFDPFSATPDQITVARAGETTVHVVEIPNGSYDVLGPFECVRAIRNAWMDAPEVAPADTSCLAKIPAIDLGP